MYNSLSLCIASHSRPNRVQFLFPTKPPQAVLVLTLKMLRRKPTAIAITSEDLAAFEDARLRKLAKETKNHDHNSGFNVNFDPSDELKPLPGDKARIVRSREERIGIDRRA
ncbi:anaphase-promoting complex APC subunit 1-domain-containing protein [Aspergillus coremiiformis]|uniref:Anaphase-promoting complex APC subunit 1-domain-containing protein n=1 Tax=Aspergillus coremiiformis TaxID=138285 RepID=A0A5N6YVH3_9EURO|nr:anaphase-promoting complex APC subunit 1-domain-containing protein [Aspergillus coremiiformis]